MRHVRVLAGLAAMMLVAACENGGGASGGGHAPAGWLPDLEAGMKESKASNRPILVDFGADW